jgi:hypothetical protein
MQLRWADHLRGLAIAVIAVAYLAGFAALFAAPGGVGDGWLPEYWRPKAILVLAGVGYVFLGAVIWVALRRGNDNAFPWTFGLIGSFIAASFVLSLVA